MIIYAVVFIDDLLDGIVTWNEYVGTDIEAIKIFVDSEKFYKVEIWQDGQLKDEAYRDSN